MVVGYTPLAFRDTLHLLADGRIDPAPLRVAKVLIDPSSLATEPFVAAG